MSAVPGTGPIGRTPRQVAGPGVDAAEDTRPAAANEAEGVDRGEAVDGADVVERHNPETTADDAPAQALDDDETVPASVDADDLDRDPDAPDRDPGAVAEVERVPEADPEAPGDELVDDELREAPGDELVDDELREAPGDELVGDELHEAPGDEFVGDEAPGDELVDDELHEAAGDELVGDELAGEGFMGETSELRRRWEAVQAGFVDDPRRAVEQADEMVSAAVAALQAHIEQRREDLAETWRDGGQASTDTLRTAFHRYRDLFDGVLST